MFAIGTQSDKLSILLQSHLIVPCPPLKTCSLTQILFIREMEGALIESPPHVKYSSWCLHIVVNIGCWLSRHCPFFFYQRILTWFKYPPFPYIHTELPPMLASETDCSKDNPIVFAKDVHRNPGLSRSVS